MQAVKSSNLTSKRIDGRQLRYITFSRISLDVHNSYTFSYINPHLRRMSRFQNRIRAHALISLSAMYSFELLFVALKPKNKIRKYQVWYSLWVLNWLTHVIVFFKTHGNGIAQTEILYSTVVKCQSFLFQDHLVW